MYLTISEGHVITNEFFRCINYFLLYYLSKYVAFWLCELVLFLHSYFLLDWNHTDKESLPCLTPLTDEGLYSGNLAQVLEQLMDWVIVLWSNGVLMVQQQLTA